jgi:hypothetical protein
MRPCPDALALRLRDKPEPAVVRTPQHSRGFRARSIAHRSRFASLRAGRQRKCQPLHDR